MAYAVGVLVFIVGLLASVMAHEYGHFSTAKHYGMKATRFFLGFGPTLWSTRRGETEYGVKALPAGGFVKIVGMTPLEDVEPGDEDRVFYKQPPGRRAVVLAAGSFMHFLIAIVLAFGVLVWVGDLTRTPEYTSTIAGVSHCLPKDLNRDPVSGCRSTDPVAPAYHVLRVGDRIVAVNGRPTTSFDTVRNVLQDSPGQQVRLTVVRNGQERTVAVTPVPVRDGDKTVGKIGIGTDTRYQPLSLAAAVPRTFGQIGLFMKGTVTGLSRLPGEVPKILSGEPRTAQDPGSVVDIARASGTIASAGEVSVAQRIAYFLLLLAGLNFFVGVFNLLPLLPLDGGHLAILGFEESRTRLFRRLGRPDPGRVDMMKVMPVTYAAFAILVGMSLLLLYAGFANPIQLQ
jgi:membrane-associated protease RseP (regulator of RpoE activity)